MKSPGSDYRDETRLVHMLEALEHLTKESVEVRSVDDLIRDDRLIRSVMYDFIVLGEAANNISENFCKLHPEVEWPEISGFRHKLVHDYAGIDYGILFDALKCDVPKLLTVFKDLVAALPQNPVEPSNLSEFD